MTRKEEIQKEWDELVSSYQLAKKNLQDIKDNYDDTPSRQGLIDKGEQILFGKKLQCETFATEYGLTFDP